MIWSQVVKEVRVSLGFTQEDFAHWIGVTVSTANRWESGKAEPSRLAQRMIVERSRAAGIPLEEVR